VSREGTKACQQVVGGRQENRMAWLLIFSRQKSERQQCRRHACTDPERERRVAQTENTSRATTATAASRRCCRAPAALMPRKQRRRRRLLPPPPYAGRWNIRPRADIARCPVSRREQEAAARLHARASRRSAAAAPECARSEGCSHPAQAYEIRPSWITRHRSSENRHPSSIGNMAPRTGMVPFRPACTSVMSRQRQTASRKNVPFTKVKKVRSAGKRAVRKTGRKGTCGKGMAAKPRFECGRTACGQKKEKRQVR